MKQVIASLMELKTISCDFGYLFFRNVKFLGIELKIF